MPCRAENCRQIRWSRRGRGMHNFRRRLWLRTRFAVAAVLLFLSRFVNGRETVPLDEISKINRAQHVYNSKTVMDTDIHVTPPQSLTQHEGLAAATNQRTRLWPGGVIPYELASSIRPRSRYVKLIRVAMEAWERSTCIKFKNRENETDYVAIYYGKGCTSDVGFSPGRAQLSLGRRCDDVGIILHELGHVIGFWHEQNRPDRDKFVRIIWSNIRRKYRFAFKRYNDFLIDSMGVPYDFMSVMHYGMKTFSHNGGLTIIPRDTAVRRLGGNRLSSLDIEQANLMYGCAVDHPHFPRDFVWWHRKRVDNNCVHIAEPADPTWRTNNYLCYKVTKGIKDIGLRWSFEGALPGMQCAQMGLNAEFAPQAWENNYICGPRDGLFSGFTWSARKLSTGKSCMRIRGSKRGNGCNLCAVRTNESVRDGGWSGWLPWQQCSRTCDGGYQRRVRMCTNPTPENGGKQCAGSSAQFRRCNTRLCHADWPKWPEDFTFGVYRFIPRGKLCTRIYERKQYFQWLNYRMCWPRDGGGDRLKVRWSDHGAVQGMRCVQITETRENLHHGWEDNFLCVAQDTPYRFRWSSTGTDPSLKCLQWKTKRKSNGWENNFLCASEYPHVPSTTAPPEFGP